MLHFEIQRQGQGPSLSNSSSSLSLSSTSSIINVPPPLQNLCHHRHDQYDHEESPNVNGPRVKCNDFDTMYKQIGGPGIQQNPGIKNP